ncbi:MAG: glycine oxidase ThiO [Phormidesmis priestleyi]|uniref:Thiazole synthase n=1 Tax=Phormidesmis priestleyi TaxID=268141 RepID=A0A2W4XX15_9CYAN|nr:MAG: glycine oxidase ThiO [Phormidesmis priestleyi]
MTQAANQPDVLIIGGGTMGLAIALELKQQGLSVTVLSRDFAAAAGHAAAGMLAPRAEQIASGPMADLCLRSLELYPTWASKLEALTGQDSGFWPCGILSPYLASDLAPDLAADLAFNSTAEAPSAEQAEQLASHSSPSHSPLLLSAEATHHYQSGLSQNVTGAHFYPEDAQVDNRALMSALLAAAQDQGIEIQNGVTVEGFIQRQQQIVGLRTSAGEKRAAHYVLATGAWSSELLPIPVTPRKGQMLSVRVPIGYAQPQPLQRVLFGQNVYIVPRRDGRIIIGATVEDVGFTPHNTPGGIAQILAAAIALYPTLQAFPIEDYWWGFRPTTPDHLPILGAGPYHNLTLATGHHRNGILLTPITAKLIASHIQGQTDPLLSPFSYQRFTHSTLPLALPLALSSPMQLTTASRSTLTPVATTSDTLTIAGKTFHSRLMTGTGKFSSLDTMRQSLAVSGSEIVTVAVRRVQTNAPGHEGLAEAIDWQKIWMLPNTAGCKDAEEAIRVARLGREMAKLLGQEDNNFVKLEVIPDAKYLLPDPIDTLKAAEQLVKEGFAVLPYINADPLLAKRLEEVGCVTVMPLGSPIGSGQGIRNAANIEIIIENAGVPVVVDAGIGSPSEAAYAMELGADALLVNSAIALAKDPVAMGRAMGMATQAGRLAYQSGRIPVKAYASASSPTTGTIA